MISRRPTPLKDEPVASFDELQDLLTENMAVMNTLNKTLGNPYRYPGRQPGGDSLGS